MVQETDGPQGGAMALALVELEFKDKSVTTGIVEAKTEAFVDMVLKAVMANGTGERLGGAGAFTSVELKFEDKSAT